MIELYGSNCMYLLPILQCQVLIHMRLRFLFFLFAYVLFGLTADAQRIVGQDTLYGNEWLEAGQQYWKLRVGEDKIVRITGSDLVSAGINLSLISSEQFTVYAFGDKLPVLVEQASPSAFTLTDAFVFVAEKNSSRFDEWLVDNPDDLLHPNLSLYSDTASYYLTFEEGPHPRYQQANQQGAGVPITTSMQVDVIASWAAGFINPNEQRYVYRSRYTPDEGFSSGLRTNFNYTQQLPGWVNGSTAQLEVSLVGSNDVAHNFTLSLNDVAIVQDSFFGSERRKYMLAHENETGATSLKLSHLGSSSSDRLAFGEIKTSYLRSGSLGLPDFLKGRLTVSSDQQVYFQQTSNSSRLPYAFGSVQNQSLVVLQRGDSVLVQVPSSTSSTELVVGIAVDPTTLVPWTFRPQILSRDEDYILLTSRKLLNSGGSNTVVDDYEAYRRSLAGGAHSVLRLEVEDLFDQFGFGVDNHPQAIRNAVHYYRTQLPNLQYLFLLGKGRTYNELRTPAQLSAATNFYLPTYGFPASDFSFSCWPGTLEPTLSTARFPAESLAEVENYLIKVRTTERGLQDPSTEDLVWRQRFLHLGGGNEPNQQSRIRQRLKQYATELENSPKSGEGFEAYRISNVPVETSQLDDIFGVINDGVGLVNFFGHSSQGVLGFNIDNPSRYQNSETLPVFFAMGCLAGDVHRAGKGISEGFVNQRNGGMIFAAASLSESFESDAGILIGDVYQYWSEPWSGDPTVGRILTDALAQYGRRSTSDRNGYVTEQFQLIGDPAVRLYSPETADYTWADKRISASPQLVDPSIQTVVVEANLYNLGRRTGDSVMVVLAHVFPKGGEKLDTLFVQDPGFRTTLRWELPSETDSLGHHKFYLKVDPLNLINEQVQTSSEINNTYNVRFTEDFGYTVIGNAADALYPPERAYVNCPLTLLGASSNPAAPVRDYKFELSDSPGFSRLLNQGIVSQAGGIISWNPGQLQEEETYFWRVAPVQGDSLTAGYSIGSFTCSSIPNQGIAFDHPTHFKVPEASTRVFIDSTEMWRFPRHRNEIEITNLNRQGSDYPRFTANGQFIEANYGNDIRSGVYVAVYDTLELWHIDNPAGGLYGTETPASWRARHVFGFRTHDAVNRQEVVTFIDSIIPDGQYVGFWTIQGGNDVYNIDQWQSDSLVYGRTIFDALEDQGAVRVRELEQTGDVPYIFTFRQNRGPLTEVIATQVSDTLRVELPLEGYWFEGSYQSNSSIVVDSIEAVELIVDDTRNLSELNFRWSLIGTDQLGTIDTLYAGRNLAVDLSGQISSEKSYSLRAYWQCMDTLERKPLNIVGMRVKCSPLPELVWNHQARKQGEVLEVAYGDSIIVYSELFNASQHAVPSTSLLATLRSESGYTVSDTLSIQGIAPLSSRAIRQSFINRTSTLEDAVVRLEANRPSSQVEQNTGNNLLALNSRLDADESVPTVRILANGAQFVKGSLLPSNSVFSFIVKDNVPIFESLYTRWQLQHTKPNGDQEILAIQGAQFDVDDANPGQVDIRWTPEVLEDGMHALTISVQDESGNSPSVQVGQSFEIVNETSLSEIVPYPNPATDNVRFFYELTGAETLSNFQVDIYTMSGRLVTSLGEAELGTLRPGRNLTEFGWFPSTQYGERLAKGTYLYRFTALDAGGDAIKQREVSMNKYTKSGFGKLVLL